MRMDQGWFRVLNRAGSTTTVYLYSEVGAWGITAADFTAELRGVRGHIELRLNSVGGDVFDGLTIYNALRRHPGGVTVYVDGVAASAASFIACAGQTVYMEPTASMMIHEAHAVGVGTAHDMASMSALLDAQSNIIAEIYQGKAGGTVASWRERMRSETWYTAAEAVRVGLADAVAAPPGEYEGSPPRMEWDLSIFGRGHGAAGSRRPGASSVAGASRAFREHVAAHGEHDRARAAAVVEGSLIAAGVPSPYRDPTAHALGHMADHGLGAWARTPKQVTPGYIGWGVLAGLRGYAPRGRTT